MQHWGKTYPILGEFKHKIETLSSYKFHVAVEQLKLFSPLFLVHSAADYDAIIT